MRASSSQLSEAVAKQSQNKSRRKISMRLTVFLARPDPWEILDEDEEPQWALARELLKVDNIFFPQFKDKPALSSVLQFDKRLVQNAHIKEGITELSDLDWERPSQSFSARTALFVSVKQRADVSFSLFSMSHCLLDHKSRPLVISRRRGQP
ncbi:hypothetical protein NW755_014834 [Fusarium falciforme]|uniref:Uncharacterized protein n=1 Tax=Fusarium falciforme TaxID=195108 RepID=A0A9W8QR44_9HYPO|nr:hypothetical protein NW755_014834 [Fusarium falciforme]